MRVQWPFIFTGDRQLVTETYPPELNPVHFVVSEGELLITYASIILSDLEHADSELQSLWLKERNVTIFPKVDASMKFKALIFDLFDTLVDDFVLSVGQMHTEPTRENL